MEGMDKLAQEEEKAKVMDKIFACAMAPVTEWLSNWLDMTPNELLPEYADYADKLAFTVDGKSCMGNLVVLPNSTERQWSEDMLKDDDAKKAASMLLDGVIMVWKTIFSSIPEENKELREEIFGFRPEFDQSRMCFKLSPVNRVALRWQMATDQLKQLGMENARIAQHIIKAEEQKNYEALQEMLKDVGKIEELEAKANAILDNCNEETNRVEEERIKALKEDLDAFDCLYLVCENLEDLSDDERFEEALERLPALNVSYRDPGEETEIDKLKKEINI